MEIQLSIAARFLFVSLLYQWYNRVVKRQKRKADFMDYFDTLVNNGVFDDFANEFDGKVKIEQFKRINDTTILWTEHPRLGNSRTPNIFIKLVFNENNVPFFELLVKFSGDIVCFQKFFTATDAIDYVNNAIDSARTRKQYRDEIWSRYGF